MTMRLCGCAHGMETKTRGPRAEHGFVGQGVLPTPEGATAATSMARRQGGQTSDRQASRWSEGVWLWCAHPLRADPVISGDAQHLNGQGHAANGGGGMQLGH